MKYSEYLLKDENGVPVENFTFSQITELNLEFKEHRYALSRVIKEADFIEASKTVRYELAKAAFNNDLIMIDNSNL